MGEGADGQGDGWPAGRLAARGRPLSAATLHTATGVCGQTLVQLLLQLLLDLSLIIGAGWTPCRRSERSRTARRTAAECARATRYTCIYIYVSIYVYIPLSLIYIYIYIYIYTHIHIHIYMYTSYTYMYNYVIYIYTHIHIYAYTYSTT